MNFIGFASKSTVKTLSVMPGWPRLLTGSQPKIILMILTTKLTINGEMFIRRIKIDSQHSLSLISVVTHCGEEKKERKDSF